VRLIAARCDVLEVRGAVIRLDAIAVIDLLSLAGRSDEGLGDEAVDDRGTDAT